MSNKREQEFKQLVDAYYSAGDRREWDATTQAEKALKDFGARWNDAGTGWIDPKAEPDSVVIYELDGGRQHEHNRFWRYSGFSLTQRGGEVKCEQHAQEHGYLPLEWVRKDDSQSIGYTLVGWQYSVTRVVVSDEG
jgi:hypothetical protein